MAHRRRCGIGRRCCLRATFVSSRSSARARRNSRPSSVSNRSLDEKNMNPPGTRTAMPTVRRSNSTAKRWVGTEPSPMDADARRQPRETQLRSAICLVFSAKALRVLAKRCSLELSPQAAPPAHTRKPGAKLVRCCCPDGFLTLGKCQAWGQYGAAKSRVKAGQDLAGQGPGRLSCRIAS